MPDIRVSQFAKELKLETSRLVEQLQAAGVRDSIDEDSLLTESDKAKLLDYLRKAHGQKASKEKITLTKRKTTHIKKSDNFGKARTIQVEVRKKRIIVKKPPAPSANGLKKDNNLENTSPEKVLEKERQTENTKKSVFWDHFLIF